MITQGRASQVTDRGDGSVLRVGGFPEREARIMELALRHGFPLPRVLAVLADGLILERIDGPTMSSHLARHPWLFHRYIRTLVDLHRRLHAIPFDGATLVHFDLHPNNVLMSRDGPVVIDWTNAHAGDPDADVAMTWLIAETSAGLPGRMAARMLRSEVGVESILRGLESARAFRLDDPHVTDAEKARARGATPTRR